MPAAQQVETNTVAYQYDRPDGKALTELETENQTLRQRIDLAKDRLQVLSGRLSFLEQHGGGNAA